MKKFLCFQWPGAVLFAANLSNAAAADYAVILKTLGNPFWQGVAAGVEAKATELGIEVDVFASPSEEDTQAQLQLFEDVLNRECQSRGVRADLAGEPGAARRLGRLSAGHCPGKY